MVCPTFLANSIKRYGAHHVGCVWNRVRWWWQSKQRHSAIINNSEQHLTCCSNATNVVGSTLLVVEWPALLEASTKLDAFYTNTSSLHNFIFLLVRLFRQDEVTDVITNTHVVLGGLPCSPLLIYLAMFSLKNYFQCWDCFGKITLPWDSPHKIWSLVWWRGRGELPNSSSLICPCKGKFPSLTLICWMTYIRFSFFFL